MIKEKISLDRTFLKLRDSIPETYGRTAYDRFRAAATYAQTGSLAKTAQVCGIAQNTVLNWRKESWWRKTVGEIERLFAYKRRAVSSRILDSALEKLEDRVKHGEHVQIRGEDGALIADIRTPLTTKMLLDITKTLSLITAKPAEQEEPEEDGGATAVNKKLIELAQSCIDVQKKLSGTNKKPMLISATPVEDVND